MRQSWPLPQDDLLKTKDLVKELLSQAQQDIKEGNVVRAQRALNIAPAFLLAATKKKIPATPDFFSSSMVVLNQLQSNAPIPDIVGEVRDVKISLASYRSALEKPITPDPRATYYRVPVAPPPGGSETFKVPYGMVVDLRDLRQEWSAFPFDNTSRIPGVINDNADFPIFVINGTVDLDGREFVNVVFSNMLIRYSGGLAILKNVRFVSCKFQLQGGTPIDELLNYVALGLSEFKIQT